MRRSFLVLAVVVGGVLMGCEPVQVSDGFADEAVVPNPAQAYVTALPETQVLRVIVPVENPTVHGRLGERPRVGGPHMLLQLALPYGYRFESLTVTPGNIIPVAAALAWVDDQGLSESIEHRSGRECVNVLGTQSRRGVNLLIVNVTPAAETVDGLMTGYYESLEVEIALRRDEMQADYPTRYRPDRYRPLEESVLNPETLPTYEAKSEPPVPKGSLCKADETYDYVIISHSDVIDEGVDHTLDEFIARKESQGFAVGLVLMADIVETYPGRDDAEKMRNFIIDAYNRWETDFVLLAGEQVLVPTRAIYMMSGIGPLWPIASDVYFQCLDGTMNSNDDDHWGERTDGPEGMDIDLFAEVYIGRTPARSPSELSIWIGKTLQYENLADDPYRQRVLLLGERTDFTEDSAFAKDSLEELRTGADIYGTKTLGFAADPGLWVDVMYDQDSEWSYGELIERLNTGDYAVINHLGHGYARSVMKLKMEEVDALTNDKPFVIYSQACYAGSMFDDCIAEHFTAVSRRGAAAVIMNSHMGHGAGSTNGPSQRANRAFWDAHFRKGIECLGVMNADAHEYVIYRADVSAFRLVMVSSNLFGDPALVVFPPDVMRDDK